MNISQPNWRNANPRELEPQFSIWMNALTAEGLHQKADIAIVLAILDREINARNAELDLAREKLSRYEHWTPDHTIEEWLAEVEEARLQQRSELHKARMEIIANARLIAAAPELLEALLNLLPLAESAMKECGQYDIRAELQEARAAIARATK